MTKELTAKDIKKLTPDELYAPADDACHILLCCRRDQYSASRIARAVEDVDAHVLNLNVTSLQLPGREQGSCVVVALRVGLRDASGVVRSLERYGMEVLDFEGTAGAPDDETARARAAELLRYLEM